jgi:hypothetical protein
MIGSVLALSPQLKRVESAGSGSFWVKTGENSIFWSFLVNLGVVGLVLKDEVVGDGAGELEEVADDVLDIEMAGSRVFWLNMGDFSVFW